MIALDLLLTHANVRTLDPARPCASTVGVLGGRVVALDEETSGLGAARTLDCQGATVLPGFNDAHCHTAWYGLTLLTADLQNLPGGMAEVYERLRAAAVAQPPEGWVLANGFSHTDYDGAYPDIAVLDELAGGRPVLIREVSGHASIANTRALELAGALSPGFADPVGGHVARDADGRPTGLLEDRAQSLVQDLVKPYSRATLVEAIDRATAEYARQGITSFGDAGIAAGWIGHSPIELDAYLTARQQHRLHARAQLMPTVDALQSVAANPDDDLRLGLDLGLRTGFGDRYLSIGPVKIFMDGAISSRTAALTRNYRGQDSPGFLQDDAETLRRQIMDAAASGWSVAVHAIGDLAVDQAVRTLVEAQDRFGAPPAPHRIEHAAVMADEQLPVLASHGIAVTPQSSFFEAAGDAMADVLPDGFAERTWRAASFLRAGVMLAGSSDRPCGEGSPLRSIQAYVDRRTRSGRVFGSPEERLTPLQAVQAYTRGSALASGHGLWKGTLAPGMAADMVVLGADPLSCDPSTIADIDVLATVVAGDITHSAL